VRSNLYIFHCRQNRSARRFAIGRPHTCGKGDGADWLHRFGLETSINSLIKNKRDNIAAAAEAQVAHNKRKILSSVFGVWNGMYVKRLLMYLCAAQKKAAGA